MLSHAVLDEEEGVRQLLGDRFGLAELKATLPFLNSVISRERSFCTLGRMQAAPYDAHGS